MKTIMLPLWVEKHAHEHAANFAEHEAGETDPNSPSYQRAYKQAFKKFCLEYYEHSLIPAETEDSIKGNPYAQPATAAFRNFAPGLAQLEGEITPKQFFAYFFANSKIPAEDREKAIRRFKAAIQTLEALFLDAKFGPAVEGNKLRIYDHQKKVHTGKRAGEASDRSKAKLEYRDVIMNRYVRLFVANLVLGVTKSAYMANGDEIRRNVVNSLADISSGDLNRRVNTDKFAETVFNAINQALPENASEKALRELTGTRFESSGKTEPKQLAEGKKAAAEIGKEVLASPEVSAGIASIMEEPPAALKPESEVDEALLEMYDEPGTTIGANVEPQKIVGEAELIKLIADKIADPIKRMSDEDVLRKARLSTKYKKLRSASKKADMVKKAREKLIESAMRLARKELKKRK